MGIFNLSASSPTNIRKRNGSREKVKGPTFSFHPSVLTFQMERKVEGDMSPLISKPDQERSEVLPGRVKKIS